MKINRLDHVNIRTQNLDEMIAWYGQVLGLERGNRPNFPFTGAWMYLGEYPVVHLVEFKTDGLVGGEVDLKLEHFAFSAQGLNEFEAKLERLNIPFERVDITEFNFVQINIWDPDGNHIHVDFKLEG